MSFRSLNPGSQIHLVNEMNSRSVWDGTPSFDLDGASATHVTPVHSVAARCPWCGCPWRKRGHPSGHPSPSFRALTGALEGSGRRGWPRFTARKRRAGTPRVFYRRTAVGGALLLRTHRAKRPDRHMIGSPSRTGWLCLCASGQRGITVLRYADVSSAADVDGHPCRLQLQ